MSEPSYTLVVGDARRMERVRDESVHLVVTSPPYWQLKDYGRPEQIGFDQDLESYLEDLDRVWAECARALRPGCRVAVNVGDQFARAEVYGRYRVIPIHAEIIRSLEAHGLDFMGSIIWQKVTTCNSSGGGAVMGSFPFPRNGIIKLDYEHILVFRKGGKPPPVSPDVKESARMSTAEWNELFHGHWRFPGARQQDHIAVFPDELPRRLIRMFTFPGELVLDPFLGSGTTMRVARELGRACLGYEIVSEFEDLVRERAGFGRERDLLLPEASLTVVRDEGERPGIPARSSRSPPGRTAAGKAGKRYGSVVRRGDSRDREEYHRVLAVHDVRTVELDDHRVVRLAGLRPNERSRPGGEEYLRDLVGRRAVYFRTDPLLEGEDDGYLHLKNRTCVNARLLRSGFADVDAEQPFRLRGRYLRYQEERDLEARGEREEGTA